MPQKMNGLLQTYISEIEKNIRYTFIKDYSVWVLCQRRFQTRLRRRYYDIVRFVRFRFEEVQQGTFLYDL